MCDRQRGTMQLSGIALPIPSTRQVWTIDRTMEQRMKRIALLLAVAALVVSASGTALAAKGDLTGNGAPSGAHYNLGLIGYANGETAKTNGGNIAAGNVIHVNLSGHCYIGLTEQSSFQVLDNNCTDDGWSAFGLPDPAPGTAVSTSGYSIYARALTPQGSATMGLCFYDGTTQWCNVGTVPWTKSLNDGKFTNVSKDLLSVCVNGTPKALFDDTNQGYYWDYNNDGLRNAQLRFYDGIPSDISRTC
jgi:hypothetical protein